MNKSMAIVRCINGCPFYLRGSDGAMVCQHPHWTDKPAGSNAIIAGINRADGVFPERCPLRRESLVVTYSLGQVAMTS